MSKPQDNLSIWAQLARTDPGHTKAFQRAGGFRGTAIKPIYSIQRMTEVFGPCGTGWGVSEPTFQVVQCGDETAVYCTVQLWHGEPSKRIYGVGGDMVVKKLRDGRSVVDDEAFKKAYTDALTNAMKHLGMSADVHMGLFDDSKYVAELRREANGHTAPEPAPADRSKAEIIARGRSIAASFRGAPMDLDGLKKLYLRKAEEIAAFPEQVRDRVVDVYHEELARRGQTPDPGSQLDDLDGLPPEQAA